MLLLIQKGVGLLDISIKVNKYFFNFVLDDCYPGFYALGINDDRNVDYEEEGE